MSKKHIGFLWMALSAVGLAAATILMKLILQLTTMLPEHVAIWRFSIAAPLMWLAYFGRQKSSKILPNRLWCFLGLGLVYAVASFSALFALDRLPSSLYVIIVYIYPSLVVIISLIIGRPVPKIFWLGLPLTFLGLTLTVYEFGSTLTVDPIGFLITLLNAAAMTAYLLLSEKAFNQAGERFLGTNWVLTGAMFAGLLMIPLLGVAMPESVQEWALLLGLGVFGTLIPILAMNISLQLLGAARGSVIITLQPVLTIFFSTAFLSETLTLQQWIGGTLVIIAIFLLQRSADHQRQQPKQVDYTVF